VRREKEVKKRVIFVFFLLSQKCVDEPASLTTELELDENMNNMMSVYGRVDEVIIT
jgi:hypothetical protein